MTLHKSFGFAVLGAYNPGFQSPGRVWRYASSADIGPGSIHAQWDQARTCVCPERSQAATHLHETFESLASWTPIQTGTGTCGIVDPAHPDPMVGKVLNLHTGANLGSAAGAQRYLPPVPSTCGMLVMQQLNNVGPNITDALNVELQMNNGRVLWQRFSADAARVHIDGGWHLLWPRSGNFVMESWAEAVEQSDGRHKVSLYLGTRCVADVTGFLPLRSAATNSLIKITQQSVATPGQQSQVSSVMVGNSQLSDAMRLLTPVTVTTGPDGIPASPEIGHIAIALESVSNTLVLNENFTASISKDNGATWSPVSLEDHGIFGPGEIDAGKNIRVVGGSAPFIPGPGTQVLAKIETAAGHYLPVHGTVLHWTFAA